MKGGAIFGDAPAVRRDTEFTLLASTGRKAYVRCEMDFLLIAIGAMFSAIIYGILHDQITVRLCLEYFTIGHPPLFWATSPTALALSWGVIATWWIGLPLGILLAAASRFGTRPKFKLGQVIWPIIKLLCVMALGSFIAGVIGYVLAASGKIWLVNGLANAVPKEHHAAFLSAGWAHGASYLFGIVGGLVLVVRTWKARGRAGAQGAAKIGH